MFFRLLEGRWSRYTAKNYRPVSLVSAASKVFEELVNKRIVDHLQKYVFFNFQYGPLDQL